MIFDTFNHEKMAVLVFVAAMAPQMAYCSDGHENILVITSATKESPVEHAKTDGKDAQVFSGGPNEGILVCASDNGANLVSIQKVDGSGNSLQILLEGSNALSSAPSWLRATTTAVPPNSVLQDGAGLISSLSISGAENQFSIRQIGSVSDANLRVVGQRNLSAVQQVGRGNSALVTQTGHGNSVLISQ